MKHIFSILFFVGWFFTLSDPMRDYPGAKSVTRIGPFHTESDCRNYRRDFLEMLLAFDVVPTETTFCEEYKGA